MRTIHDINPSKIDDTLSRVYWEVVVQKFRQYDAGLLNTLATGNYPTISPTSPTLDDYFKLSGRPGGQIAYGGSNSGDSLTLRNNPYGGPVSDLATEMVFYGDAPIGSGFGEVIIRTVGSSRNHFDLAMTNTVSFNALTLNDTGFYLRDTGTPGAGSAVATIHNTNFSNTKTPLLNVLWGNSAINLCNIALQAGTGRQGWVSLCQVAGETFPRYTIYADPINDGLFSWDAHSEFRTRNNVPGVRWVPHAAFTNNLLEITTKGWGGASTPTNVLAINSFGQLFIVPAVDASAPSLNVTGSPGAFATNFVAYFRAGNTTADIIQLQNTSAVKKFFIDNAFRINMVGSTSGTLTFAVPAVVTPYTLTWPATTGTGALYNDGTNVLTWASLAAMGSAPNTSSYVTLGADAGLTSERILTGTASQITITDSGAGAAVTLSTPQNLDTAATFRVGTLGIGAAAAANIAFDLTGSTSLRAKTETTISSSPTAYDFGTGTFIRQDVSGTRSLRGVLAGVDGQLRFIRIFGSTDLTIKNEDAGATAANRIHTSTGTDIVAGHDQLYVVFYDATTQRTIWQKWAEPGGTESITGLWTHVNALTIDQGASVGGGSLVMWGASGGSEPFITFRDASTSFDTYLVSPAQAAGSNIQLPTTLNDTLVAKATTDNLTNKTLKNTCVLEVSTNASGVVLQDATTSSKKLRHIISGAVGTSTWTLSNTAARDYAFDSDVSCRVVSSGNTAVAAGAAVTAGLLGKHDSTGNTTSIAATTIGKTVPAGMYKVHWYVKITTAGDVVATDNLTITVAWNDGTAQSRAQNSDNETAILSVLPVNTINRAFSGDQTIYCAASTDVTAAAALVNGGVTNPVFDFRARLEAL